MPIRPKTAYGGSGLPKSATASKPPTCVTRAAMYFWPPHLSVPPPIALLSQGHRRTIMKMAHNTTTATSSARAVSTANGIFHPLLPWLP